MPAKRRSRPAIRTALRRDRAEAGLEIEALAMPGNDDLAHALLAQDARHGLERRRFAVDGEGAADRPAQTPDPGAQLGPIGVGRVSGDGNDLRAAGEFLAEDLDDVRSVLDPPAEGIRGLESDEEDAVPVIAAVVR